jgi:hypothetical protein
MALLCPSQYSVARSEFGFVGPLLRPFSLVTSSLLLASRFATVRGAGYRVASNTGLQKASFLLNSGVFYSIEVVSRQETANQ